MFMKNNIKIIILLLVISCTKNTNKNKIEESKDIISLIFSDTITTKKQFSGSLKYSPQNIEDSVNIDKRFIILYLIKNKSVSSLTEMKKEPYKVFIDTNKDGVFNFTIEYDSVGKRIFSGIIEDKIFYKKGNNDKVKIITKETSFVKDVYVIDKKNNKSAPVGASMSTPDAASLRSR